MNQDFYSIIDGLIAQNHRLGQKQIAMECVCSAILAQLALLSPSPTEALDRMNSELCGTAMGVAADLRKLGLPSSFDSRAITTTISTIGDLSEKELASKQAAVSTPEWA
jgi:hypothetical protein